MRSEVTNTVLLVKTSAGGKKKKHKNEDNGPGKGPKQRP